MRIEITNKNFKPKDTLKDLLTKKISKFDKYFRTEAVAKVKLEGLGNDRYTMEITISVGGTHIRSGFTSGNMYDNIDIILPKIERQIAKYRTRLDSKLSKNAFDMFIYEGNVSADKDNELSVKPAKVVKTKNFELALMDVNGAIEEMDLLEHNFYVFLNSETSKVNVVYKRNDGDYGLISPEY